MTAPFLVPAGRVFVIRLEAARENRLEGPGRVSEPVTGHVWICHGARLNLSRGQVTGSCHGARLNLNLLWACDPREYEAAGPAQLFGIFHLPRYRALQNSLFLFPTSLNKISTSVEVRETLSRKLKPPDFDAWSQRRFLKTLLTAILHKNWFADLNQHVSVSRYNIWLTLTAQITVYSVSQLLLTYARIHMSVYSGTHWLKLEYG